MQNAPGQYAIALALSLLLGSAAAWMLLINRRLSGQRGPAASTSTITPNWTGIDVVLIVCGFAASLGLAAGAIRFLIHGSPKDLDNPVLIALQAVASLVGMAIGVLVLRLHARATWEQMGLNLRGWAGHIGMGLFAFLLLSVPLYALQALLSRFVPGEHPLLELLKKDTSGWLLAISWIAAGFVAPLSEEFLFRVVLQGWLERVFRWLSGKGPETQIMQPLVSQPSVLQPELAPVELATVVEPDKNPFASPQQTSTLPAPEPPRAPPPLGWVKYAPILISATVFAVAHLGSGPAPIPIFFLALALGYLYQRTHSIWPGFALHAALNNTSLLLLYLMQDAAH